MYNSSLEILFVHAVHVHFDSQGIEKEWAQSPPCRSHKSARGPVSQLWGRCRFLERYWLWEELFCLKKCHFNLALDEFPTALEFQPISDLQGFEIGQLFSELLHKFTVVIMPKTT